MCFDALQVGRLLLAAQLFALVVGLTACGGDTLSLDPVASAATKTSETGSSRVAYTIAMDVAGESVEMTGSGVFDYRHPRGSASFRMRLPGAGDMRMEMRMLGTKMYMRMPDGLGGEALPFGKEWLGFDLDKTLEQAGLGGFNYSQQQDPAQLLQYLRAAGGDLEEAGSARVRGVETTRYIGSMNLRKALEAGFAELGLSKEEQQRARDGMQQLLDQVGVENLPIEVFVDEDGLLRRMTMEMGMKIEGEQLSMSMQMDLFDFGVDVSVQAPPKSQVMDLTGALGP